MEYNLKDLVEIKYGKNQKHVKNPHGKYPILGTGGVIDLADQYLYDKPSVLIGRKGSIGKVKYIDKPFWTIDTLFYTKINETKVLPKFLYYKLSMIDFNYYNEGTTIPSLRTETLYRIKLDLPHLSTQKKVINTLGTIDNKIEINKKIIANLEELSQTLFNHWFVDFEFPDKDGNPYKSSGGEMIDSEIGEIPKGWEISKLDKIINIKSGKRPRNKVNIMDNKNKTPIIGASKIMGYTSDYLESEPILVMGRVGTHGVIQRFNNNVWPSDNTFIIKSKFMIYSYFILINIDYKSLNRGSTQPLLSQKDIKNINIIIPKSDSLIVKYEEITNIYFKEIDVIRDQISYLIELRDTLLPKLMSGELEIPDDIEVNSDELSI
ncbi:restriction endonuclease subunit S [Staphylococcus haemolyticus]|uniref:restriction endonuclease subunit S n=1 Tax=Staphylococcus haemolyticus TaxID=1283 RepID=UPI0034D6DD95